MGNEEAQDAELLGLEQRIDALIELCTRLQNENRSLRIKLEELAKDRAHLIEKTALARSRVEAMIMRLKSMEHGT